MICTPVNTTGALCGVKTRKGQLTYYKLHHLSYPKTLWFPHESKEILFYVK
jgi:hypothetical protein